MDNEQQDNQSGEPTELAKTLHGDRANAEQYEQPEAIAMPAETLIAKPGRDKDAVEGDDSAASGTAGNVPTQR